MFTNLIESASHVREFKRRSSFFLITVATYAAILFAAGIASVYAYDAQLEAQTSSVELLSWVPPVARENPRPIRENQTQVRRPQPSSAPIDSTVDRPIRTDLVTSTNDPTKIPDKVGTDASHIHVYTQGAVLGDRDVNPLPHDKRRHWMRDLRQHAEEGRGERKATRASGRKATDQNSHLDGFDCQSDQPAPAGLSCHSETDSHAGAGQCSDPG